MNFSELAGAINSKVSRVAPEWSDSGVWDRNGQRTPIVHFAYSSVLAVIGDAQVEWVAVEVGDGSGSPDVAFTLTVWTADLVVHAVREHAAERAVVAVSKRSALTGLEVLSAPLLTTSDWGFNDASAALRLTYPAFTVVLRDRNGDDLLAAVPSFIEDLS